MILNFVTADAGNLVDKITRIKKSGVKCLDVIEHEVVETATGKHVHNLYQVVLSGNRVQTWRAKKIINEITGN